MTKRVPGFQLCRAAALTGFAELLRARGQDPLRLAAEAGLPAAALSDPDLKIPASAVAWMLEAGAERCALPDFAIRLAETRRLSNMGAVGLIAREQPSLRKSLEVMVQYQWLQNEALHAHIEETAEIGVVRLDVIGAGPHSTRQASELAVGALCRNVRALLGERWRPESVCFAHAAPGDLAPYRRLFGVSPLFDQEFDGIVFTRADFDAPIASADPAMAKEVARYVNHLAKDPAGTAREAVGELIILLLPTGVCDADRVGRHLGVDRRTVHRRLVAEGTNFSALMDEMRMQLARSLMANPRRSLAAVAEHLGFSGASAFSHWFQRTHGCSPRAFRRTLS
ncbi:MAG: AraC family transcriptional regulator [Rhizomicrobium sp.]